MLSSIVATFEKTQPPLLCFSQGKLNRRQFALPYIEVRAIKGEWGGEREIEGGKDREPVYILCHLWSLSLLENFQRNLRKDVTPKCYPWMPINRLLLVVNGAYWLLQPYLIITPNLLLALNSDQTWMLMAPDRPSLLLIPKHQFRAWMNLYSLTGEVIIHRRILTNGIVSAKAKETCGDTHHTSLLPHTIPF